MRESGFYWIRIGHMWEVAHWCSGYWWSACTELESGDDYCDDDYLDEIDERRIERGEHKDLHRPAMEIIREKVQAEQQRDELVAALDGCQRELAYMIEKHNVQNTDDGSWLYDYQTPCEAQQLIFKVKAAQAGE